MTLLAREVAELARCLSSEAARMLAARIINRADIVQREVSTPWHCGALVCVVESDPHSSVDIASRVTAAAAVAAAV